MIKTIALGLAAAAVLGACATTNTSSLSATEKAAVTKAVDNVTSDVADQLGHVSAAQAMDCQMAFGVASAVLNKDGSGDTSQIGGLLARGIYEEVYKRKTDPATASLDSLLEKGPLMTAMGSKDMSTEDQATLVMSTMNTCAKDMQVAVEKTKALRESKS